MAKNIEIETATFGGGCFWCTEAVYMELNGVIDVKPGYSGGHIKNPTYEQICTKTTGHAEVIQITFDPKIISFTEVLEVFFMTHNPTTLNRQGNDVGPQYRSVIFYRTKKQKEIAEKVIQLFTEEHVYDQPIVTEITAFDKFYPAEDYHVNYFARNKEQGYCQFVIAPKVEKFRQIFSNNCKE
jgi:peptide-methionine (S)-S-oxide reductase